jgi:hypothetical protein
VTKKKAKPFQASKAVKSVAREVIGAPPPTRRAPDKTKNAADKHKATLGQLLQDN